MIRILVTRDKNIILGLGLELHRMSRSRTLLLIFLTGLTRRVDSLKNVVMIGLRNLRTF